MLSGSLAALQIVIPLVAAPVAMLVRTHQLLAWLTALVTGVLCSFVSVALLGQVHRSGEITYALGGWAAPFGIEYRVDFANAFVLLIISLIYLATIIYAPRSVGREVDERQRGWLYTAWILCFTGLCGITISGDVFNVFVFLEISSLSSYVLISFSKDRRCLTAALRYLIMGTVGATFFLIGVGLLYSLTGTLNMTDLSTKVPELTANVTAQTAFGFIGVGLGIKIAAFPLYYWLPNAYAYAPSVITAFLAGTATKAAVYVFARMIFTVFSEYFITEFNHMFLFLLAVGVLSTLVPSVVAIFQSDLKRLFAWSSIGQIGYMIIGFGLATIPGIAAAFIHLFNHALIKTALFMALGGMIFVQGGASTQTLVNAGKRMPWTMAAIVIGGLSLIGVPFTTGFVSKWFLVSAALDAGSWFLAAVVLFGSLITAAYVWKIVELAYFSPRSDEIIERNEAPLALLIPTWLLVAANIYFGVNPTFTDAQATLAAQAIMGLLP